MKNVLVAFNEPKLIKAITKNVRKTSAEDIVFTVKPTKSAFLDEISSGRYDCAILMESVGRDPWTIAEMVGVADSYNTTLIPIISESYKGGKDIMLLSSVGITSAVFVRKGGVYKADEILRMIEHPRTLREARMYYGIETYADHKSGDMSIASENKINEAKAMLSANRDSSDLGQILLQILIEYRFDMSQAAQLLECLDKDMTTRLQKTVEYYDLLEDLYKHNLVAKYHIPREIKKLRKQRGVQDNISDNKDEYEEGIGESVVCEDADIQEVIVDEIVEEVTEGEILELDIQEDGVSEEAFYSADGLLDYGDEEEIPEEEDVISASKYQEGTGAIPYSLVDDEDEDEFTFAGEYSVVPVEEMEEDDKEIVRTSDKKRAGELKRQQKRELEEELEEMKEEGIIKQEHKKINPTLICVIVGCILLLVVLAILLVKVTVDRARAIRPQNTEAAYNTPYNTEDVATYELGDKGELILKNEEGEVLYDSGNQPQPEVIEEEMSLAIVEEEDENKVDQQFNDISGFEQNKDYKGLDLVNLINGTQGADCMLKKANGALVEVVRGEASVEDFLPSGLYRCQITDGVLTFIEQ